MSHEKTGRIVWGSRIFPRRAYRPERAPTGRWDAAKHRKAGDGVAFSPYEIDYAPERIRAPREATAYINRRGEYVLLPGRNRRKFK